MTATDRLSQMLVVLKDSNAAHLRPCPLVSFTVILAISSIRLQAVHHRLVTQWLLESFLINLGIPVLGIRSMQHQRERDAAVRKFNDPTDDAMCMVTSPKTSGTGVNMQTGCSDTLFVDAYTNAQAALQASGRTLRLGQKHKCTFYTLTTPILARDRSFKR
ncbi:MAG: hypothetical protein Q9204_004899 [Flavoplaca sp. TL-2023a]